MKTRLPFCLLTALIAGAFACGDTPTAPDQRTPFEGATAVFARAISIGGRTSLAEPGETSQLTATITFSDGTTKEATGGTTWSGTPTNVISITPNGFLTALAYGTATVTARYGSPAISAQANVRVMPDGTFVLHGFVTESGFGIDNVRVEARSTARTVTTTTDFRGLYRLSPVDADATIRAEKDGFELQIKHLTTSGDQRVDFQLQRTGPLVTVDGVYELTITASPSCTTLPAEVMHRTSTAQVTEKQGQLFVVLKEEPATYGDPGFTGSRTGQTARFDMSDDVFAAYAMVVVIGQGTYLSYVGRAVGEIADRRIAATFDGTITLRHSSWSIIGECRAADHRLELVR
jgi:hypothetical protein